MREILFRGKDKCSGHWLDGSLVVDCLGFNIVHHPEINEPWHITEVDPETVGQFTGLVDKNGTKIFEGDIVRQNNEIGKILYESNYCTFAVILKRNSDLFQHLEYDCEIIGNIFDNPEILQKEE